MSRLNLSLFCAILIGCTSCIHNVLDYGAVSERSDTATEFQNANAFQQAVAAANSSADDKEVYFPSGYRFYMMPSKFINLYNVTITIDSYLYLSSDNENWPLDSNKGVVAWLIINDSKYIYIRGTGTIDG